MKLEKTNSIKNNIKKLRESTQVNTLNIIFKLRGQNNIIESKPNKS
jgi:hypothetical protein